MSVISCCHHCFTWLKQPPSSRQYRGWPLPGPSVATTAPLRQQFRSPPSFPSSLYQTVLVLWIDVFGWWTGWSSCVYLFFAHFLGKNIQTFPHSLTAVLFPAAVSINSWKCKLWCWLLTASPLQLRLYCPWADNLESPKTLPFKQDSKCHPSPSSMAVIKSSSEPLFWSHLPIFLFVIVLVLWFFYQQPRLWSLKGKISQDSKTSGFSCGVWIFFLDVDKSAFLSFPLD